MTQAIDLVDLLTQVPELDDRRIEADGKINRTDEGKFTGPKWSDARKLLDPILAAGREAILGLVGMLVEVDDGQDYRVRYVLHALALEVCRAGMQPQRSTYIQALASQLGGDRPKPIQAFLIRELQVAGDASVVPALGKLLLDDELGDPSLLAILAIGQGAAAQCSAALGSASGRRRLALVQALGTLRDESALPALRQAASDTNRDTRLAALWALASLGDLPSAPVLLKAADGEGYERIQATKACLILAERLIASGQKTEAARIYRRLQETRTNPSEAYIRDAAAAGLAATR